MVEMRADVVVVGGGVGGVAATLAAAEAGRRVILTEETDWLGGQLTAQAVPPDEHPWIEQFGCTARYRRLRDGIRDHYRRWYPLTERSRAQRHLNPGAGFVSALCHEPRAALAVLDGMLAPHAAAGRVQVLRDHRPVAAGMDGDRVGAVTVAGPGGDRRVLTAPFVLDATETGDLLALTGTEHVTGFESRSETGEPHAPDRAQPDNLQAVSHCFALDHRPGEDHTIDPPRDYGYWREFRPSSWPGPLLGWVAPLPQTLEPVTRTFTPDPDPDPAFDRGGKPTGDRELWCFRRILARRHFVPGAVPGDITLVNWPMIDYVGGPVLGLGEDSQHREAARRLSLSLCYWLQTEAPRPDGGAGWPGLRLRGDVTGTLDGLAKSPYVRESRRLRARTTVAEQDVSLSVRGDAGSVRYPDSVGVGSYRIDLHPSTGGDNYVDVAACPFEVPLGALVPVRVENLLAAGKNLGTTHVTNGCYRVHPVEWNVGEVAGALAAFCLDRAATPAQVHATAGLLADFQGRLDADGVERRWPRIHGY